MSLVDLASIGNFVSGVAVLVTLVFVLVQLRQTAAALRRAEFNAAQSQWSVFRHAIIGDRDVARIWIEGLRAGPMDAIDEARFAALLSDGLFASMNEWDREKQKMLAPGTWRDAHSGLISHWLTTERGANWWTRNNRTFDPGFRASVQAAIDDSVTTAQVSSHR